MPSAKVGDGGAHQADRIDPEMAIEAAGPARDEGEGGGPGGGAEPPPAGAPPCADCGSVAARRGGLPPARRGAVRPDRLAAADRSSTTPLPAGTAGDPPP